MSAIRYAIAPNVHTKEVKGEESVIVDFNTGNYYVLDGVSTFLWRQIQAGQATVDEMQAALLEEYETTAEQAQENIGNFCRYMVEEKLVGVAK